MSPSVQVSDRHNNFKSRVIDTLESSAYIAFAIFILAGLAFGYGFGSIIHSLSPGSFMVFFITIVGGFIGFISASMIYGLLTGFGESGDKHLN